MIWPRVEEINAGCRQLILDHLQWCYSVTGTCHRPCIFGDLVECVPPGSFCDEDPFYKKLYDFNRADLMKSQHCFFCTQQCPLFGPSAESDMEVAGLPCTDQSAAGNRLYQEGPTAKVFLAHAKRHIEKETPLLILENVQERDCGCPGLISAWLRLLFKHKTAANTFL